MMIDLHCHILPGLDDGARDLETALEMAQVAQRDGIRIIVATPHTDLDKSFPTPETVRQRVQELNAALGRAGIAVHVLPGSETQLSPNLVAHLRAGRILTLGDAGRYLLIELPFTGYPTYVEELFFQVQLAGIIPVLAHPERAAMSHAHPETVAQLARRGTCLQLNADSVNGKEGRAVRNLALRLVREGLAFAVASDAHDTRTRPPKLSGVRRVLRRLGGEELFRRLTLDNPALAVAGAPELTAVEAPA